MHALRALALFAPLVLSCAGPGLTERHHQLADEWSHSAPPAPSPDDPLAGRAVLERREVVALVLARNPSLDAARWAWRAALARYPQETSLDDPMLEYSLAPASAASSRVDTGQRVALSQALPWPGKLGLRGEIALAEAEAAARDHEAVRLRLATLASFLYDELYLAERKLAVNGAHRELLAELREIAVARYEAGEANQQDPLEAELEEAELLHRDVQLRADLRIAGEQLNVLLHRAPELPLPKLPSDALGPEAPAPGSREALLEEAQSERPELRAAEARVRAREAAVALARREYFPDVRVMGAYDSFWEVGELQPMVGLELNLPLRRARRAAALDEAEAELAEARSMQAGLGDQLRFAALRAFERLAESQHALEVFRDRMLPAARDRVASARVSFETGQSDFSTLIDAERGLRDAELGHEEARVALSQRRAELARALGARPEGELP